MLLFVVIATSQTTLLAENEANSSYKNTSFVDVNGDKDIDDPDSLLFIVQVSDSDKSRVDQCSIEQYFADISLNTLLTIRAPPYLYL
jgi:hypothetical protein